jgi:micrococcal nuclease
MSKKPLSILGGVFLVLLLSISAYAPKNFSRDLAAILEMFSRPAPIPGLYEVVSVVDGDTIKVKIEGETKTLRLIGIDTPETVDPRKPVQCFGRQASDKAKEVLSDKMVRLEADPSQGELDKYGRLLRYVFLPDGTFFNRSMIEEGYAHEYTYETPYKYQAEFKAAELKAREGKLGLWDTSICSGNT